MRINVLILDNVREAAGMLRAWERSGATMAAACIGTFVQLEGGRI